MGSSPLPVLSRRRQTVGVAQFGESVEDAQRLKGALVMDVARTGNGYRVVLALADGGMLEGALTQDEYDALVLGGIPLMTNVTIQEPGAPGG